jgi:hypothetical protein
MTVFVRVILIKHFGDSVSKSSFVFLEILDLGLESFKVGGVHVFEVHLLS